MNNVITRIANRISRVASLINLVDTIRMEHPQDIGNMDVASKNDPRWEPVFKIFEAFDVPVSIWLVSTRYEEMKDVAKVLKDPNSVNFVHYIAEGWFDPEWVEHDMFHVMEDLKLGMDDLTFMNDIEKRFLAAFKSDYGINGDVDKSSVMSLIIYLNSDPEVSNSPSMELNMLEFFDIVADIMIPYIKNNGAMPESKLIDKPLWHYKSTTNNVISLSQSKQEEYYSRIMPVNRSLPAMNKAYRELLDIMENKFKTIMMDNIGKIINHDHE